MHVREAWPEDAPLLAEMLAIAADWRPDAHLRSGEDILQVPEFAHYVAGWPRLGDVGVIAIDADEPVGAAWYRLLLSADRGYGYVADDVPEITIGVRSASRGRGIGGALLRRLIERAEVAGVAALSLSVEDGNPAVRLYQRLGFIEVGRDDGASTMLRQIVP